MARKAMQNLALDVFSRSFYKFDNGLNTYSRIIIHFQCYWDKYLGWFPLNGIVCPFTWTKLMQKIQAKQQTEHVNMAYHFTDSITKIKRCDSVAAYVCCGQRYVIVDQSDIGNPDSNRDYWKWGPRISCRIWLLVH